MARLMCIATHHKGGTVWIKTVFRALSDVIKVPWVGVWSDKRMDRVPETGRAFLCNWAGYFPKPIWDSSETAFLHVVRDPRDVLLSGCRYHQIAKPAGEKFLHTSRADLGGLTYQEHLNGLQTPYAKLLFEMDNKHSETLTEMRNWPWGDSRSFELRYEDLMADTESSLFSKALMHLGLLPPEVQAGARAFWDNSLFGGLKKARAGHVASGAARRWEREMPRAIGEIYAERFGEDLIALGYEKDTAWVGRLPESAPT